MYQKKKKENKRLIYLHKYKCKNKFYSRYTPSGRYIFFVRETVRFTVHTFLVVRLCSDKEYARCVTRTCLVREFYKILPSPLFDGIRK